MKFKDKIATIKETYQHKESIWITIISGGIIGFIMFYFTHFEQIYYNIGALFAYVQTFLQILLTILFGLNMTLLWHKLKFAAQFGTAEVQTVTVASILSILVSGCPACGITLASYLGLATFFASLPLYGLELKIIGVILLLYSTDSLAKNMKVCKIPKNIKNLKPRK